MKLITIFSALVLLSACGQNDRSVGNKPIVSSDNNASRYAKILDDAQTGKEYSDTTDGGEKVSILVMEEYNSASGKVCKKFKVNESAKLSCRNINEQKWLEARAFR